MPITKLYNRTKVSFSIQDPQRLLTQAKTKFEEKDYIASFDLYEILADNFPKNSFEILAEIYDRYQMLNEKDRYTLYQSRFFNFGIKEGYKVLDIGSGHNPFPFATHLSDISLTNHHYGRAGVPFKNVNGKPSYEFNVENIPFDDNEFDFVYCSHVLEHTEDPAKACSEIMRIGKRGYIETPVRAKDLFFNTAKVSNHNWNTEVLGDTFVFRKYTEEEKEGISNNALLDISCSPQTDREKSVNALVTLKANRFNNMFCWENDFNVRVLDTNGINANESRTSVYMSAPAEVKMKFSFIMIVLNGMPFIECSLNSVYKFAHEIIIVEGAVENCRFAANADGSSTDGTVEFINSYPDPGKKIKFMQGLWAEKLEMHNKALEFVTGDYVWILDSDEVYRNEDLNKVKDLLNNDTSITQINVIPDNFWKGFKYTFVSDKFFEEPHHTRRIFKFKKGSKFVSHRPPTLVWPGSDKNTSDINLIDGMTSRYLGIRMFHYSYVLDDQVNQKIILYKKYGWDKMWGIDFDAWYNDFFLKWNENNRTELEKDYAVWTGDPDSYTTEFAEEQPEAVIEFINKYKLIQEEEKTAPDVMMKYVIENIYRLKKQFSHVKAIETGTIRSYHEKHESTRYISEALGNKGDLISVDIEPKSIEISRNICKNAANVQWVLSDSKKYLASFKNEIFHFALLDSVNDKDHIMDEFRLILPFMHPEGIVVIDDAGITSSGKSIDANVAAQKGHKVWEYLNSCGVYYEVVVTPNGHGTQIVIQLDKEKQKTLINNLTNSTSEKKSIKIAGHCEKEKSLTQIDSVSEFATEIKKVISDYKPLKILETGTFHGTGTTNIIASALKELELSRAKFFSIEVNIHNHNEAIKNLKAAGLLNYVTLLHGLTVPGSLLPTIEEIENKTVKQIEYDDIYVDHKEEDRAKLYYNETNFKDVEDDLIEQCLITFNYEPDFVLLDSGGHMGNIEFNYIIEKLNKECIIALDDINHIKHKKSFMQINSDPRFRLITSSDEKFGFCVARFTPSVVKTKKETKRLPDAKNILFIRTDSIGDNILASSMLKELRNKYTGAEITILCQEHIAPLYEYCPFINNVVTIDKKRIYVDEKYKSEVIAGIKKANYDLVINTVLSSEKITDLLCFTSGAPVLRIDGNAVNSSQDWVNEARRTSSACISTGGGNLSELLRYENFIVNIGLNAEKIIPVMWLGKEEEKFADEYFRNNNLDPAKTIVLFAGAQNDHRLFTNYGKALSDICRRNKLSVVAIGDQKDYSVNQQNLNDIDAAVKINLSGQTTILQAAAIIKKCKLAVGAETGNAHICCAVGTPNVILLGGGHFGRFMPYSNLTSIVCLPLDCYGCNWKCSLPTFRCVNDIATDVLSRAIDESLNKSSDKIRIFVQGENTEYSSILNKYIWNNLYEAINCSFNELAHAEALIEKKQYSDATNLLLKILEKKPDNTEALNDLAVVQLILGNVDVALKTLNIVLALDPANEVALENMQIMNN